VHFTKDAYVTISIGKWETINLPANICQVAAFSAFKSCVKLAFLSESTDGFKRKFIVL